MTTIEPGLPSAMRRSCALLAMLLASSLAGALAAPVAFADDPTRDRTARAAGADYWVLKRGMRGPTIAKLQRRLGITADGVFGRQTARAVKAFQRRRGLTADGIVGPVTAEALGIKLPRRRTAARRGGGGSRSGLRGATRAERRTLRRIARCESGGNPRAVSPDGLYRGKYQFHRSTWRGLGGRGDPADAPEHEQDRRALQLLRQSGTAPWAACA